MPRPSNETSALLADLKSRLDQVVATARAEGHAEALEELRSLVGAGAAPMKRGPGRPKGSKNVPKGHAASAADKPAKKRKSSWAGLSPEARLARVNAIRKGKGLPPKTS
jgi:hypothetical protein